MPKTGNEICTGKKKQRSEIRHPGRVAEMVGCLFLTDFPMGAVRGGKANGREPWERLEKLFLVFIFIFLGFL